MATRTLSTVRQLVERHPAFNEGGVRWAIFNEQTNGLAESGAILRVGRKVLIDEDRWFAWIDARNGIKSAA